MGEEVKAYELLVQCPLLDRSQVCVDFSARYDRETHPDARLEASIDDTWDKRRSANPALFNATKFRYGGHVASNDSRVCLRLGLTDYKTFVGTNLSSNWEDFLIPLGTDDRLRCKHMSSPLGNGAVVETQDSHIILLQRSTNVGEFPEHLVFPGGHSEPAEIGVFYHSNDSEELNKKIVDEMFDGIVREVCEETGIPSSFLSDAKMIGISRRTINVRPTIFFHMKCGLTSHQVSEYYTQAADSFESTKLILISKDELPHKLLRMPGCHQGGAILFLSEHKI